jgi:hypothetical protein
VSARQREFGRLQASLAAWAVRVPDASFDELHSLEAVQSVWPSNPYPWSGLEEQLEEPLPVVGYGSLLNTASAARTFTKTAPEGRGAVVALGMRRVFNYLMPPWVDEHYGRPDDPCARGALNAYADVQWDVLLNGVILDLHKDDVQAYRERETAYDLEPAMCLWWDAPEQPPFVAYVLCAPDTPYEGERHTGDDLLPHVKYAALCEEGAAAHSPEFRRCFRETSYLADRTTTLATWQASCA